MWGRRLIADDEGLVLELRPREVDELALAVVGLLPPPSSLHTLLDQTTVVAIADGVVDGLFVIGIDRGEGNMVKLGLLPQEILVKEDTLELFLGLLVAKDGSLLHHSHLAQLSCIGCRDGGKAELASDPLELPTRLFFIIRISGLVGALIEGGFSHGSILVTEHGAPLQWLALSLLLKGLEYILKVGAIVI